jgi:hypothetical protein
MLSSEIIITDESPINTTAVGIRPAITFTRGPVQSYTLGIDDMTHFDIETGKKRKSILIPGTMSINCCSRSDIETENLAWWISEAVWMHKEDLMKVGFFDIGRFVIGSPSPAGSIVSGDSADEWFCTTISSPFQFHRTSERTPLGAPMLEHIDYTLASRSGKPVGPEGPPGQVGANLPYEVESTLPDTPNYLQPHPLNPAQTVVVRSFRPYRPGITSRSSNGGAVQKYRLGAAGYAASSPIITKIKI